LQNRRVFLRLVNVLLAVALVCSAEFSFAVEFSVSSVTSFVIYVYKNFLIKNSRSKIEASLYPHFVRSDIFGKSVSRKTVRGFFQATAAGKTYNLPTMTVKLLSKKRVKALL